MAIQAAQIADRKLDLVIPAVGDTATQRAALAAAREWTRNAYNVTVTIVRMR